MRLKVKTVNAALKFFNPYIKLTDVWTPYILHQARVLNMSERQTQTVNVNFYIALLLLLKNIICANQIFVTPSLHW